MVVYKCYKPGFPINTMVDQFIYFEGDESAHRIDRFLPDGNTEIIIDLNDTSQYIYDNLTLKPIQTCRYGWVSGIRTNPISIPSGRNARLLIIAVRKGKALPLYRFPLYEIADMVVEADRIFGNTFHLLREKLLNARSLNDMFSILETYLIQFSKETIWESPSAKSIEFTIKKFSCQPDIKSYQDIENEIGYSQKHFISLFKNYVGVTPKQYLRILRFQKSVIEIEAKSSVDWVKVSLDCGYYDQAHFIHDFKVFSGLTPISYLKQKSNTLNYIPVG